MAPTRLAPWLLVAVLAAASCGGDADGTGGGPAAGATPSAAEAAFADVCEALRLAEEGDFERAREAYERADPYVHELARRGRSQAPQDVGMMLEAKQGVERALSRPEEPSPDLPQNLFLVSSSMSRVAAHFGESLPDGCPGAAA